MALSNEDKADVARSMGKALANKVSKVTRDKYGPLTMSLSDNDPHINKPKKTGAFKTSYGTAGGGSYGYKSKAEKNRIHPEMKSARKAYNDARAADGLSRKRGAFGIK